MKYESAAFEASFGTADQLPPSSLPEIAFSGRSNVGKSSLLNRLLNRKNLARVSSVPGKTVTVNFFRFDSCRFVDLPGYGYAKVNENEKKRWSNLMETYFSSGRDIRLVVQLIDMRREPTELDLQMIDYMLFNSIPFIVVMTKADKLNKSEFNAQLELISEAMRQKGDFPVVPFSSTKGTGVPEVKSLIENSLNPA